MDLLFPYKGFHKGLGAEKQPAGTTPWIQNMRVMSTQDDRFQGGQRGGMKRAYVEQVSGMPLPIVVITAITVVD